ncbi:cytochrome ubiquinol oxidase subunit I [Porphyromonas sp. oral taxon 275]|uniref:cytochrome ubiquinol oxidase subunit I n=1 Tax=Porphyromonas sp. oral taxon 275 TaxID=712435 RepID=UPI001BAA64CE|nr:cytochrome ubiquinol oxidase subunit I [Porphyromonas sp. oral taxon 275]QUB43622.1 cytochrome ubiquinol oxidase subunit I [Porphyromonas sp. oral taxon 275]
MDVTSLLAWSRAQFALTAMYHWLFVPLTLGLGVIMSLAETQYYRTGDPFWKKSAQFWQKLFGINFAIGVATGIILEFQFGTNWSNYSWFVGDIFGAPLAIEGILAFFMESTFIAVMFFGWGKVSKGFHLASSWLTIVGATISAVWILIANAWMQNPQGMIFNPETMRNEMHDFWAVALSPTAVIKFLHTVTTSWTLGSFFALGICALYLLRGHHTDFARRNLKIIAPFGLLAAILSAETGHLSAVDVAKNQPMKLAAMEAIYDTGKSTADGHTADGEGVGLGIIGVLNPSKQRPDDAEPSHLFSIEAPRLLSFMVANNGTHYVPGINNILEGGYHLPDGTVALSAEEKMQRGRQAIDALNAFRAARKAGDSVAAQAQRQILEEHFPYYGYGYFDSKYETVPNVPLTYYSFRAMVGLGGAFLLLYLLLTWYAYKRNDKLQSTRWLLWISLILTPMAWIATEAGWVVAEVGRQPWTIQNLLPVQAAISKIEASSVIITFTLFALLFTIMLVAEVNIMRKAIKSGPEQH